MLGWKSAIYIVTIAGAFFFAAVEFKIRSRLKDQVERQQSNPSDFGMVNDIKTQATVNRLLLSLSGYERIRYKRAVILKFALLGMFLVELVALQR